jgi:2-dehydropantoate 2-reductase
MSDNMKFVILGAGNIGTLIGAKLAQLDESEVLIHGRGEHAAALAVNGISVAGVENFHVPPDQYHLSIEDVGINSVFDGLADYILITSKAGDVEELLNLAKRFTCNDTRIIILSNGLGHIELGSHEFGSHRVIPATTTHGVWRKNPGSIEWAGLGAINIGRGKNSPNLEQVNQLISIFQSANLKPTWNDNGNSLVWSKVLINIAINPIAAITGQKNGELLEGEMFETCTEVMLEAAKVARLEGVELADDSELIDNLKSVLQNTKDNKCSMLQDVRMGKPTEIKFLNRMIVNKAEKYGLATPLNQLLSELIESLSLY